MYKFQVGSIELSSVEISNCINSFAIIQNLR